MKVAKVIGYIILIAVVLALVDIFITQTNSAVKVINTEYSAEALLKKYEYFKNLSAGIDKLRADIEMYQEEIKTFSTIEDKEDKFYREQRKSELLGIIAEHNGLCSEYNSAMSKFNYRFTNAGDLPSTNLKVLPREIKPYINNLKSNSNETN